MGKSVVGLDTVWYITKVYTMFREPVAFDWDSGNLLKNWEKHGVGHLEAEQLFFNQPLLIYKDARHAAGEARWYGLGKTDAGRLLMVVFTVRSEKLRVISARPMSRKERRIYEREENDPRIFQ